MAALLARKKAGSLLAAEEDPDREDVDSEANGLDPGTEEGAAAVCGEEDADAEDTEGGPRKGREMTLGGLIAVSGV